MSSQFYNGKKLLSKLDLNGKKPELYFCIGNRRAGKTFYFSDYLFKNFIENGKKFGLIYRNNYELNDVSTKFFGDIGKNNYPDFFMYQKNLIHEKIITLYVENVKTGEKLHCGFAYSLNAFDQVKRYAHLLNEIEIQFFDEFQSEDNHYLPDELKKFQSIYTSLSRGYGKQYSHLPTIFVSNAVTLINPYFSNTDIPERLRENTKFLKGNGYVLEMSKIEISGIENSGVYSAFNSDYADYAKNNVYLLDDCTNIIKRPSETNKYICSFLYKNKEYAIRKYRDCIFVDRSIDRTNPIKFSADKNNIKNGYISKSLRPEIIIYLRNLYFQNLFRFSNLESKVALIRFLCYS